MQTSTEPHEISLRPATALDAAQIWEWNNRPEVRAASRNQRSIPWEEHARWFRARLSDPRSWILVVQSPALGPVGVVRLQERAPGEVEVSISLDAAARGQGIGRDAIRRACRNHLASHPRDMLYAWIEETNTASLRCFSACGFLPIGAEEVYGRRFACLTWAPIPRGGENAH